jgi:undecaprenyl-diphosphatase
LYDAYKDREAIFATDRDLLNLLVGGAVAAVVGYLSIEWLLGFLKRNATYAFIVYRLVLGGSLIGLLATGRLH